MLLSNAKWILLLAAAASTISLCSTKDKTKCEQARSAVRTALDQSNLPSAKQWREQAWKQCDDRAALDRLDKDIVDKEAEVAAKATKDAQTSQVLKLFQSFISSQMASPSGQCAPEKTPDFGWCTRSRRVTGSTSTFDVRYRQDDPSVAKFATIVPGEAKCADLGGTEVRSWKVARAAGGQAQRLHCKLTGAGLDGFEALASMEPDGTRVTAASPKWLATDSGLRRQLDQEGK